METRMAVRSFDQALINYRHGNFEQMSVDEKRIFCENPVDFDNTKVTLRYLCELLGIAVPTKFADIADEPRKIAFRSLRVKPGDISLIIRSSQDLYTSETKNQYHESLEKGAKLVIMSKEEFATLELNEADSPVILMDYANERIFRLFSLLRRQQKAKVVMLTGSVGKTTTKDLCYAVVRNKFNSYANENNTNTPHQVAMHLFYNSNKDNEVFIHEAGAGYFSSVRFSASILQPDILILTNVYSHHLQVYKSFENIFEDKVSGDDYLSKDGIIITNYDDENIRNHAFEHQVKSFSVHYPDADYRAIDICQKQEILSFDIYEKETGKTTHICVKILGEHNVYNILAAFIMGKTLGLSDDEAKEALLEYSPVGVRQNMSNIGGVHLLMDCYNSAEESLEAMLAAGEKFELDKGCKKIALIGGENKLGKEVKTRSKAFGAAIAKFKIDQYLFCGTSDRSVKATNHFGDALSIQEGFTKVSTIPNEFAGSIDEMANYLKRHVKCGDLVMVKGLYYLQMPIAVDKVFGTSYCFDLSHNRAAMKTIRENSCTANLIEEFGELELTDAVVDQGRVVIPDRMKGYPVFRIKYNVFKDKKDISSVSFGASVKNIGAHAFSGCTGLTDLSIPNQVKIIESRAFNNCTNLQRVKIGKNVTHIGYGAFAGCSNLKDIFIPESVGMIEDNAFAHCENITISCVANSFAHQYAVKNNIPFALKNRLLVRLNLV